MMLGANPARLHPTRIIDDGRSVQMEFDTPHNDKPDTSGKGGVRPLLTVCALVCRSSGRHLNRMLHIVVTMLCPSNGFRVISAHGETSQANGTVILLWPIQQTDLPENICLHCMENRYRSTTTYAT